MDFFERQAVARRNTKWLVVYFALAVLGIVLAINLVVGAIFSVGNSRKHHYTEGTRDRSMDFGVYGIATVGTLLLVFCGSAYKTMQLSSGGSAVAEMLGGRPVESHTSDPGERRLLNIIEEMSIASGTPVPQVYVMDEEPGINAFAAGHSTKDMVIAVTRGSLRHLNRDELQGVIAHEYSHILNGDMRLNIRLMGLIFGILCLAVFGRILLSTRGGRDSKDRNPLPLLGLALLAIGWIGVFFGHLIKSAVSRQREFLADSAAVQFTRNPAGLASALKKIGGCGSIIRDPNAEDASHLFFANGLESSFASMFSTHPPLEERIKLLDPSFDGNFTPVNIYETKVEVIEEPVRPSVPPRIVRPPQLGDLLGAQLSSSPSRGPGQRQVITLSESIGAPTSKHLDYAADLRSKLPEELVAPAREPMSAVALVYALLLSPDESMRSQQLQQLQPRVDPTIFQVTARLAASTTALVPKHKLPLVFMAMTALRRLSPAQYAQFSQNMQFIINSDEQIDLFEYALQKMVSRHLEANYVPPRKPVVQFYAIKALTTECEVLLSALAYAGQTGQSNIEAAFHEGVDQLALPQLKLLKPEACGLNEVDAALERLNMVAAPIKKSILNACARTVAADNEIQDTEAELLRAIADSLDCPIPPIISLS